MRRAQDTAVNKTYKTPHHLGVYAVLEEKDKKKKKQYIEVKICKRLKKITLEYYFYIVNIFTQLA